MKKIAFISLLVMGVNLLVSAQVKDDTAKSKSTTHELGLQYLKKANKQRTTGLILLGSGFAAILTGLAIQDYGGIGLFLLGTGSCIVSMPVLITSGINRRRYNVILKQESVHVYNNYGNGKAGMVSLGLSISIGGSRN